MGFDREPQRAGPGSATASLPRVNPMTPMCAVGPGTEVGQCGKEAVRGLRAAFPT